MDENCVCLIIASRYRVQLLLIVDHVATGRSEDHEADFCGYVFLVSDLERSDVRGVAQEVAVKAVDTQSRFLGRLAFATPSAGARRPTRLRLTLTLLSFRLSPQRRQRKLIIVVNVVVYMTATIFRQSR